jgi:dolichyl-diphosphooligosaccharide--protein glycosyltransferase
VLFYLISSSFCQQAVVPAHLMRSVGGGYDNESIAMTAMCATFYFWCRSLRGKSPTSFSWIWGTVAGIAYVYMVAAWGGYIFVLNMIAFHALALVAFGKWTPKLHRAYTLFYVIGTYGAIQVPVVGLTPLKSLEQLGEHVISACTMIFYLKWEQHIFL